MGGGVGKNLTRAAVGAVTVGGSELSRTKPFQPGGRQRGIAGGLLSGPFSANIGLVKDQLSNSAGGPPPPDTSAIDVENQAKAAENAVQTANAEARRARAAKRQSSVLGSYQAKQSINAATLQPAQPRRSVLG